jgi:hypothetical protein
MEPSKKNFFQPSRVILKGELHDLAIQDYSISPVERVTHTASNAAKDKKIIRIVSRLSWRLKIFDNREAKRYRLFGLAKSVLVPYD